MIAVAEFGGERLEVYGLVALRERKHRFEDEAVRIPIEVFRLEDFRRFFDGRTLDQH